jgi:hypothetical protein
MGVIGLEWVDIGIACLVLTVEFSLNYKKRLGKLIVCSVSFLAAMSTTDAIDPGESLKDYLSEHPRMIGALFTILLVLSQAGPVVAGGTTANPGP